MIIRNCLSRISAKAVFLVAISSLMFTAGCANSDDPSASVGAGAVAVTNPQNTLGEGPAAVSLSASGSTVHPGDAGSAGNYVILAKTGISNVPGSVITGHIGVSPAAASYITGFSLVADSTNVFSTSTQVVGGGQIYAANYAVPTPSNMTTSIGSMETGYTDEAVERALRTYTGKLPDK